MYILLLVILAIIVLLTIGIFRVASSFLRAAVLVMAVVFVILAVLGGVAVKSALDMKNDFQNGSGLLLIEGKNSSIVGGLKISSLGMGASSQPSMLSGQELSALASQFREKQYKALLQGRAWMVAVKESSIKVNETLGARAWQAGLGGNEILVESLALQLSQEPLLLLEGYRKGNVSIYPERLALKAARILPESLLSQLGERLK